MDIQNNNFLSIDQLKDRYITQSKQTDSRTAQKEISFQEVLRQKSLQGSAVSEAGRTEELRFSKHASGRLADRGIELSNGQLERLSDGVRKAGQKGIKDSLVIVDELAFIVNVPNNTVVTAMNSTETDDNVFTNINGAVIM
ncbi:MAG: flagellar protein [Butyrivibrio sp.]|nr:flagellar protein [Muribaculum sp.]MCM1552019.1 flagellar protein [Butyrivibrio sp.]